MRGQKMLFENPPPPTPPRARRTDPSTSHVAAAGVRKSGRADTHKAMLLAAVRRLPGQTSAELAEITRLDRHEAARRLPELKQEEEIVQGAKRRCRARGTLAVTWWAEERTTLE